MTLKRLVAFLLILTLLGLFSIYYPQIQKIAELTGSTVNNPAYPKESATLLRVIDGDTIEVIFDGREEKESVRLLGINAPEKKMPMANESKFFLEQFVNRTIYLQRDIEDEDKYHRKLRYAFYEERFLNLELLELGYVIAYIFGEQTYNKQILRAEAQARNLELGIWKKSAEPCAVQNCIILEELNQIGEYFIIKNSCNFACNIDGWFVKDTGRNVIYLSNLSNHEERAYSSEILNKEMWDNSGDNFFMFDQEGKLVLFYDY